MPIQQVGTVDELIEALLNHSDDRAEFIVKHIFPILRQLPQQFFLQNTADNRDPLERLDPTHYTVPYAYFLVARCNVERPDVANLLTYILEFLRSFDPTHIRLVPEKFLQVAQGLCRIASLYGNNIISIKPLTHALQKYSPSANHLTNLHQFFIKECLLTKCYRQALPILDNDITEIETTGTGISYIDHLLYHYYGAMVYIGLKNYTRALNFLVLVISTPAIVTSQVQAEAYKKFSLVSLLLHGKIIPLPKYTAPVVVRSIKNQCQAYQDYASAFESLNVKRLRNEFNKCSEAFRKDGNFGLVKQTLDAIYRRKIQQLTQTYLTLSLVDIADAIGLEGRDAPKIAERYILQMIESREIFATISHSDQGGMVSFHDDPDMYNTSNTILKLEEQIAKATKVSDRVIQTDRLIGCSREYLVKSKNIASGGVMPGGSHMDDQEFFAGGGGFDNFDPDDSGRFF
ncbi:COP9 signalosome complex subunit 3 [Gigaspora margarita]|uniref:COP9 signalosome complex subunit 3 n=1 Tax=Gigaspora margarita TaxID=4874 RepID=A0A8H4A9Z0_GIGMA|nr:COP9 signalosome complex subunit 3 [Gigaspora margarita]